MDDYIGTAEICVGLMLLGRQSPAGYDPAWFPEPYNKIVADLKEGKDVMKIYGSSLNSASHAASRLNGLGDADWVKNMKAQYLNDTYSEELGRMSKNGKRGILLDADKIMAIAQNLQTRMSSKVIRADEIDLNGYEPFEPSGSPAIDAHLVGFPKVGTVILGAKTFSGKTTMAIKLSANYLETHPNKEVHFITLEDMAYGWKDRAEIVLGKRPKEFWNRFIIQEFAGDVGEIFAESSRYPNLGLVVVDYVDILVRKKSYENYTEAYESLAIGTKALAKTHNGAMTTIICAQFSRTNYHGGVPTPSAINYTGEAGAWAIWLLYNPSKDWEQMDAQKNSQKNGEPVFNLVAKEGKAYIIAWKEKAGFRKHPEEFPGAIRVNWTSKKGFDLDDPKSEWCNLSR